MLKRIKNDISGINYYDPDQRAAEEAERRRQACIANANSAINAAQSRINTAQNRIQQCGQQITNYQLKSKEIEQQVQSAQKLKSQYSAAQSSANSHNLNIDVTGCAGCLDGVISEFKGMQQDCNDEITKWKEEETKAKEELQNAQQALQSAQNALASC